MNRQKGFIEIIFVFVVAIALIAFWFLYGQKFVSKVKNNPPQKVTVNQQTQAPNPTPQGNTVYLGQDSGEDVLYLVYSATTGVIYRSDGSSIGQYTFKTLKNPQIIYTDSKFQIQQINNFVYGENKKNLYLSFIENDQSSPPLNYNQIIEIDLSNLKTTSLWSLGPLDTDNSKYSEARGAGYLQQVVINKYLAVSLNTCYSCSAQIAGVVIINLENKKEKYLQGIGNIKIDTSQNIFSYQRLGKAQENCTSSQFPDCKNGMHEISKPMGVILTSLLP